MDCDMGSPSRGCRPIVMGGRAPETGLDAEWLSPACGPTLRAWIPAAMLLPPFPGRGALSASSPPSSASSIPGLGPARERSRWRPALDRARPGACIGREATLADSRTWSSPMACASATRVLRLGDHGAHGRGAGADLAKGVAVPQRWWVTAGNFVDDLAMRWLIDLLGFPASTAGTFTAGGSTANLVGIRAARQHAGERLGLRPSLDGIAAMPEPRVYASTDTHHVVGRALGVLGMGRANLRTIPLDGRGTIDLDLLQAVLDADSRAGARGGGGRLCRRREHRPGRPARRLSRIAHERGTWLHVDGAYGGFGILDDRVRDQFGDLSTYDSFAIDPHKWLAAPVGTGAAIVRDEGILGRAFTIETGDYVRELHASGRMRIPARHSTDSGWGRRTGAWTSRRRRGGSRCGRSCVRSAPRACVIVSPATTIAPDAWPSGSAHPTSWSCSSNRSCRSLASATGPRVADEAELDAWNEGLSGPSWPGPDRPIKHAGERPLRDPPLLHRSAVDARRRRRAGRRGAEVGRLLAAGSVTHGRLDLARPEGFDPRPTDPKSVALIH